MIATLRAALLLAASAMLCPGRALAQTQPTQPTTPAAVSPSIPAPTPAVADDLYRLGRTYRIETLTGSTFTGALISLNLSDLELETKDLGRITVPRSNIRRSYDETLASSITTAPASYYDIGNGNRLFFAPTGRGLRRGVGDLHDVDLFLAGINYGITDNFSLGGYVSLVPFVPLSEQLLILTPKFSAAVAPKLNLGVGALYIHVPFTGSSSGGAGILYGALTYGSAASNLTLGLGYGFFQGKIGSTPVLQIGGQTRVSRRISLVSENYI